MDDLPELKFKDTVKINGMHFTDEMQEIIRVVRKTAPPLNDNTIWITSANDSKHKAGSKHYIDQAFDFRTKNLIGGHVAARQWTVEIAKELGPNFDVVLESDHLHIERDVHIEPSKTDYAWMAGFLDGDGSFSLRVYKRPTRRMVEPIVQITQRHPEPIARFKALVAGGTGHVEEVDGKSFYRLAIVGRERLIKLLDGVMPYLVNKRSVASLLRDALEMQGSRGINGYSEEVWAKFFSIKSEIEKINKET